MGSNLRNNTTRRVTGWHFLDLWTLTTAFYRKSDIPTEAQNWHGTQLLFPVSKINLAHSFKDKARRLDDVMAGTIFLSHADGCTIYFNDAR